MWWSRMFWYKDFIYPAGRPNGRVFPTSDLIGTIRSLPSKGFISKIIPNHSIYFGKLQILLLCCPGNRTLTQQEVDICCCEIDDVSAKSLRANRKNFVQEEAQGVVVPPTLMMPWNTPNCVKSFCAPISDICTDQYPQFLQVQIFSNFFIFFNCGNLIWHWALM